MEDWEQDTSERMRTEYSMLLKNRGLIKKNTEGWRSENNTLLKNEGRSTECYWRMEDWEKQYFYIPSGCPRALGTAYKWKKRRLSVTYHWTQCAHTCTCSRAQPSVQTFLPKPLFLCLVLALPFPLPPLQVLLEELWYSTKVAERKKYTKAWCLIFQRNNNFFAVALLKVGLGIR